jgi:hypothetical protein
MSFQSETKTQRVYVTQTGHQHSAKLSHFVGRVPDLASCPLPLLYNFASVLEAEHCTIKFMGAKCIFVTFWWNRNQVPHYIYNTKYVSLAFVQPLGVKLNKTIHKKLLTIASLLQNSYYTEWFKIIHLFIWGWQSLDVNACCPATTDFSDSDYFPMQC